MKFKRDWKWYIFTERGKLELLALTEKKLKGNGEVLWCGVNGTLVCVHKIERARGGCGHFDEQYVAYSTVM